MAKSNIPKSQVKAPASLLWPAKDKTNPELGFTRRARASGAEAGTSLHHQLATTGDVPCDSIPSLPR